MQQEDGFLLGSQRYAARLLLALGWPDLPLPRRPASHPAHRWSECGAMFLTGQREGPPLMCPVPLGACADGALTALQALSRSGTGVLPVGAELLGERAALAGLTRNGRIAPGGACRLLDCADGRLALTLARADDWASLSAWIGLDATLDGGSREREDRTWAAIASIVSGRAVDELVERGRLLSLAVAADRLTEPSGSDWFEIDCEDPAARSATAERPLVVDLSSLWAGPLCTHLLALLGAQVVKVESTSRPDGARRGSPAFYDLLNHGKASVAIDLGSSAGRDLLRRLLAQADIVIEASRPRALLQLGIDPTEHCTRGRALSWISITGHGRQPPADGWVAFGDDAAIAAGLGTVMCRTTGDALFCGDAIADPLAGMHAALVAWWSFRRGGARRVSISLRGVAEHCIAFADPVDCDALRERQLRWTALARVRGREPQAPRARELRGGARPLGADNNAVAAALDAPRAGALRAG